MSGSNAHPDGRFITLINCIDGRAHPPVVAWLQDTLPAVAFIDRITAPGVDAVLAGEVRNKHANIKAQVEISINAHYSNTVVVVGHHGCAGNPVSDEEHLRQIKQSVDLVQSWNLPVRVLGLWLNKLWQVEKVVDIAPDHS